MKRNEGLSPYKHGISQSVDLINTRGNERIFVEMKNRVHRVKKYVCKKKKKEKYATRKEKRKRDGEWRVREGGVEKTRGATTRGMKGREIGRR